MREATMLADANQEPTQDNEEIQETPEAQPGESGGDSPATDTDEAKGGAPQGAQQQSQDTVPRWRLNEEIAKRRELESRFQQPPQQQQQPAEDQAPKRPKEADFNSFEEFEAAKESFATESAKHAARQEFKRLRADEARQAQGMSFQQRITKAKESFIEKVYEAEAKEPGLVQKLQNAPSLREEIEILGLKESDDPVSLARHLADNPNVILQLNQMPLEKALREMGRMEAKLQGAGGQPQAKVSQMPRPMQPVGTGKAGGSKETGVSRALSLLYPT